MSRAMVESMRAMTEQFSQLGGEAREPKQTVDLVDEDELREKAAQMGEGVYFISVRKVSNDQGEGYKAYYGFRDINTVRINQNPGDKAPAGAGGPGVTIEGGKKETLTFRLTEGDPAELVITGLSGAEVSEADPQPRGSEPVPDQDDPQTQVAMKQMQEMFKGLRVALAVEVLGEIVETNATHVRGSRVTLMELDFGKLLEMPEKLKAFAQRRPEGISDAKELMKDIPGIKVELAPEVRISFEKSRLKKT